MGAETDTRTCHAGVFITTELMMEKFPFDYQVRLLLQKLNKTTRAFVCHWDIDNYKKIILEMQK